MEDSKRQQCEECKIYSIEGRYHSPNCSRNTIENVREQYEELRQRYEHDMRAHAFRRDKLREQIEHWQGKFLVIKQENNALRKKIAKLKPNDDSAR